MHGIHVSDDMQYFHIYDNNNGEVVCKAFEVQPLIWAIKLNKYTCWFNTNSIQMAIVRATEIATLHYLVTSGKIDARVADELLDSLSEAV